MKRLLFLLLPILFYSCCKRPSASQSERETDRTERVVEVIERVRDSVIYVPLPKESVMQGGIKIRSFPSDTSHLETSIAESDAWIDGDGNLNHSIRNKPASLPATVPIKEIVIKESEKQLKSKEAETIQVIEKAYIPTFFWLCAAFTVFVIGYHLFRFIRKIT